MIISQNTYPFRQGNVTSAYVNKQIVLISAKMLAILELTLTLTITIIFRTITDIFIKTVNSNSSSSSSNSLTIPRIILPTTITTSILYPPWQFPLQDRFSIALRLRPQRQVARIILSAFPQLERFKMKQMMIRHLFHQVQEVYLSCNRCHFQENKHLNFLMKLRRLSGSKSSRIRSSRIILKAVIIQITQI